MYKDTVFIVRGRRHHRKERREGGRKEAQEKGVTERTRNSKKSNNDLNNKRKLPWKGLALGSAQKKRSQYICVYM